MFRQELLVSSLSALLGETAGNPEETVLFLLFLHGITSSRVDILNIPVLNPALNRH